MKKALKKAMAKYLKVLGDPVVPEKKWLEVFHKVKGTLPADCVGTVVNTKGQQIMVLMCWEPSLNDVSVRIVTPDGKVHDLPPQ